MSATDCSPPVMIWSTVQGRMVRLESYWRRYKSKSNPPTIAELAAEAKITPSSLAAMFFTEYGEAYKQIASSRRSGKSQILLSDDRYAMLFLKYKSRHRPTLAQLAAEQQISPAVLSTHFRRLFGEKYMRVSTDRRAHTEHS